MASILLHYFTDNGHQALCPLSRHAQVGIPVGTGACKRAWNDHDRRGCAMYFDYEEGNIKTGSHKTAILDG